MPTNPLKPSTKTSIQAPKGKMTELQKKSIQDFEKFLDDAADGKESMIRGGMKKA